MHWFLFLAFVNTGINEAPSVSLTHDFKDSNSCVVAAKAIEQNMLKTAAKVDNGDAYVTWSCTPDDVSLGNIVVGSDRA